MDHSKAPWKPERIDKGRVIIHLPGDGSIEILGYNTEANSRLVAAAPELLATLERISIHARDWLKWDNWITREAQAAIAKITDNDDVEFSDYISQQAKENEITMSYSHSTRGMEYYEFIAHSRPRVKYVAQCERGTNYWYVFRVPAGKKGVTRTLTTFPEIGEQNAVRFALDACIQKT